MQAPRSRKPACETPHREASANIILMRVDTCRNEKGLREENTTDERLVWSQETVTFDAGDHPENIVYLGKHTLVLDLIMGG